MFFRKAHRFLYFGLVLFFFLLAYPALWYFAKNPKTNYQQIASIRKWFSVWSARMAGIRFQIDYESPIDWSKPYVICPNHTSTLDITALTYLCPVPFSFIGKHELLDNFVTRLFFKSIDIPVDRKSKISSYKAFKRGNELLKEGKSVVVFPEGKIDDEYPPRLHPFKAGPFKMAIENQIEILPVIIHNAWKILWDDGIKYGSRPGTIYISVLNPIDTKKISDGYNSIEDELYSKMNTCWLEKPESKR